ncbi:hypothetical protein BN1723_013177 [Verticillium longisporum]|uniref:DUF7732 domain-containing protein n=1 Tax=Verticillium longisporum TaxID=100787 RepID=A0A0G4LQC5_VERLO|nr:hypothetical protein BN1723_013177 [Verticillium longisporum]
MKIQIFFTTVLTACALVAALVAPEHHNVERIARNEHDSELWKRKGGGGGARGGGGGGGGNRGGGGSSSNGGRPPNTGGSQGGRTVGGSGPQPRFGGGRYYGGGAVAPYRAGNRSPVGFIAPFVLVGAAALYFWPGSWYGHRVQHYEFNNTHTFFNESANENQTKPVICGCIEELPCGCDEPQDRGDRDAFLNELIGNGSYAALNKSVIDVGERDGRSTILLNGTLPNDTTLADANAESAAMHALVHNVGWWPMAGAALAAVLIA